MSLNLPERPSHEFLKKLAKERLAVLRATDPTAALAAAQQAIARDYGFSSWRALKSEVDLRRAPNVARFVRACTAGDTDALREVLTIDPSLARAPVASGGTGLHLAARHPDAIRLLLEHGADPNARDAGDNATPLHFAAAHGNVESVRLLLDAGADVHGKGDLHHGDVIGWAARRGNEAVVGLLLERGARHHIFSAMALGDRSLVRRLVEHDSGCLSRRRSRFESGQSPVHAAFAPPDGLGFLAGEADYPMLALLIELGADVDARDDRGRTPLDVAMLRGDREAIALLTAAGAAPPPQSAEVGHSEPIAQLAGSVQRSEPMFTVPDIRATVRWYVANGFTLVDRYEDSGDLVLAKLSFGNCRFGLSPGATTGPNGVSLWLYTDRIDDLYRRFKENQHRAASTAGADTPQIQFAEDLYEPFYGGRQFSIRDLNGMMLIFWQPAWLVPQP